MLCFLFSLFVLMAPQFSCSFKLEKWESSLTCLFPYCPYSVNHQVLFNFQKVSQICHFYTIPTTNSSLSPVQVYFNSLLTDSWALVLSPEAHPLYIAGVLFLVNASPVSSMVICTRDTAVKETDKVAILVNQWDPHK